MNETRPQRAVPVGHVSYRVQDEHDSECGKLNHEDSAASESGRVSSHSFDKQAFQLPRLISRNR